MPVGGLFTLGILLLTQRMNSLSNEHFQIASPRGAFTAVVINTLNKPN